MSDQHTAESVTVSASVTQEPLADDKERQTTQQSEIHPTTNIQQSPVDGQSINTQDVAATEELVTQLLDMKNSQKEIAIEKPIKNLVEVTQKLPTEEMNEEVATTQPLQQNHRDCNSDRKIGYDGIPSTGK